MFTLATREPLLKVTEVKYYTSKYCTNYCLPNAEFEVSKYYTIASAIRVVN
jgi:hypothetical protein